MSAVSGREYKGGQGTVLFKHGETSQILTLDVYGIVVSKKKKGTDKRRENV